MLKAIHKNFGMVNASKDYWSKTEYNLTDGGEITILDFYNLSGIKEFRGIVSDKNMKTITKILKSQQGERVDYNGYDGSAWEIEHTDAQGNVLMNFKGYIYGYPELLKLTSLLGQIDAEKK